MPPVNAILMKEPGQRRDNVELTPDCGGLLDACAAQLDSRDGGGIVRWRSHISELGVQAFVRVGRAHGEITAEFAAATALITQNYRLIHANGKDSGYAILYAPAHHEGIEKLGQRYLLGRKMIYLRRAAVALGLAEQDYINPLHANVGRGLREFLLQLRTMLR